MKCKITSNTFYLGSFKLEYETKPLPYPGSESIRNIYILYKNTTILDVKIDERFNSIVIIVLEQIPGLEIDQISNLIHMSYLSLRDSDPGYGNDSNGHFFEHSKTIFVEDFISYLISKNREKIINQLNG